MFKNIVNLKKAINIAAIAQGTIRGKHATAQTSRRNPNTNKARESTRVERINAASEAMNKQKTEKRKRRR